MNLFILDLSPFKSAEYYQDLHVNKIIIEGSQLLAAAYPLERLAQSDCPRTQKGTPRVHGHYNHPMSKWVRKTQQNFTWTLNHLDALYKERVYRFDKPHFTKDFINWCWNNTPNLPEEGLTEHPQCFTVSYPECIVPGDPVKGYQNYYNKAKREFKFGKKIIKASWTKRNIPYFFEVNI
jgi:hypothetical protein